MNPKLSNPVSVYALGGLFEVGKNTYCIEDDQTLIIIDAGILFPGDTYPGVDYCVPDYTHLKNNRSKIKALFITHGHEDHIGGIPYLLQAVNIPVIYAPRLAAAMIKLRLEEHHLSDRTTIVEYDSDTKVKCNNFEVSFFRVTHSIPDSYGIAVNTPEGRIVTTGDFKIDLTPIGPDIELATLSRLGDEGVTLFLSDSTNAENEGYTPSERNVYDSINEIFISTKGRLIVSTFSSNISRIQQICECAVKANRKIAIVGRSMENTVQIARDYGYIKIPDSSIININELDNYDNNEIVILCTGSQGEPMAALSRIASGGHKDIKIIPGDTVVFSSSAIPGNGISIDNVVNQLTKCGADVITNSVLSDIHSSGHPGKQELRFVLKLIRPKYFMPVHGEVKMLKAHSNVAKEVGINPKNIFICDNGDTIKMVKGECYSGYKVETGITFIDGTDSNGLPLSVIEDRKSLYHDGVVSVVVGIDSVKNLLVNKTYVISHGFVCQKKAIMKKMIEERTDATLKQMMKGKPSYADFKRVMKEIAADVIFQTTKRSPMIVPIITTRYTDADLGE